MWSIEESCDYWSVTETSPGVWSIKLQDVLELSDDDYLEYLDNLSIGAGSEIHSEFSYFFHDEDYQALSEYEITQRWMPYPLYFEIYPIQDFLGNDEGIFNRIYYSYKG